MTNNVAAGLAADDIITSEVVRQDAMWGRGNERADISDGQMFFAALAQALALEARRKGEEAPFDAVPDVYPADWSGFRDYGSDVANLAVIAAFVRQEMKRLISIGAPTNRLARNTATQPYTNDKPFVQL